LTSARNQFNILHQQQTGKASMKRLRFADQLAPEYEFQGGVPVLFSRVKPKRLPPLNVLGGLALVLAALFHPASSRGVEISPFNVQNQSPLVMIYGLPPIGESSLIPAGKVDGKLYLDLANNFIEISKSKPNGEAIVLDGESARITLDFRYGITRSIECGIQVPYVSVSGGFLDGFIESFHDATGSSQGLRPLEPRNRLLYFYEKDGKQQFFRDSPLQGLGDIRLSGGWQLYQGPAGAVALRGSLKLSTGKQFLGSGGTDLALWVTGGKTFGAGGGQVSVFGGGGILGMTEGDLLPDQQKSFVWFGNIGAGWSPLSWLTIKGQIDAHTSFYEDSELRPLSRNAALLTFGATAAFSRETSFEIGVTEDLAFNTAPDIVFHLALRHRF
jgi:hypothetical protein